MWVAVAAAGIAAPFAISEVLLVPGQLVSSEVGVPLLLSGHILPCEVISDVIRHIVTEAVELRHGGISPSVKVSVIVSPTTEIGTRMTNVPDLTLTQTVSGGSAPGIVIVTIVVPPTGQPTILKLKKPKGKLYEGGNGLTLPVGTADRLPHHPQLVVNVAVPPTEVITVAVEGKMTVVV